MVYGRLFTALAALLVAHQVTNHLLDGGLTAPEPPAISAADQAWIRDFKAGWAALPLEERNTWCLLPQEFPTFEDFAASEFFEAPEVDVTPSQAAAAFEAVRDFLLDRC